MHDSDTGTLNFFAVNRNGSEPMEIDISIEGFGAAKSVAHTLIKHDDLEATNTENNPENVKPAKAKGAKLSGGKLSVSVPAHSYSMISVQL